MKEIQLNSYLNRSVSIRLTSTLFASALFLIPVSGAFAQTAPPGPLPATAPVYEPVKNQPSESVSQPSTPTGRPAIAALLGGKPDLSGAWNINTDQSDDPRKKLAQATGSNSSGAGSGNHGGWNTGGGWGGMGGGQPSGGMGGGQRNHGSGTGNGQDAESRDLLGDMSQLTIEQTTTTLKVTDPSGDLLALYRDAPNSSQSNSAAGSSGGSSSGASSSPSSTTTSSSSSGNASSAPTGSSTTSGSASTAASGTPVAHWEGNQLVVETKGQRGSTLTRTFVLSSDNQQLYVTTELKSPRFKQPVVIDSVYDPAQ